MFKVCFVAIVALVVQSCLFGTSSAISLEPAILNPKCPAIACKMIACLYGEIPTVLANGCPGCPRCRKLSECPQLFCAAVECAYGTVKASLANGCPSCPRCRKLPECELIYCLDVVCPYGDRTQSNGCPGWPECLPEPVLTVWK